MNPLTFSKIDRYWHELHVATFAYSEGVINTALTDSDSQK